jgi:serine/threonine protein kinase
MYQLLSGRAPFEPFGEEPAASIVLRILRDPVTSLRSGSVPYRLARLVESGLAKDPGDRPRDASEVADELRSISAEEGWSAAIPDSHRDRGGRSDDPSRAVSERAAESDSVARDPHTTPGVTHPSASTRNVVLPEGGRRGSRDRPPRRS